MTILLAQPFADHFDEVAHRLRGAPGAVLLLQSRQLLFSVSFRGSVGNGGASEAPEKGPFGRNFSLTVDLRRPSCPVYFDFAGIWERLTGGGHPGAYPLSLPKDRAGRDDSRATPKELRAIREAVMGPVEDASEGGTLRSLMTSSRARSARRARRLGANRPPVVLEPVRSPRICGLPAG